MAVNPRDNTTSYAHPQETTLLNLHKAMEYNAAGAPVLRVNNAGSDVYATIDSGRKSVDKIDIEYKKVV
jgi:hypothetical protein